MKRTLLILVLIVVGVALGIGTVIYVTDVQGERQALITITGPVRVYDRESPPGYMRGDDGVVEFLHEGDRPRVLGIHEHRGIEAIRVRLRDGREGYIFCCDNFLVTR